MKCENYNKMDNVLNFHWILCEKYRKVLPYLDVASIDTLLWIAWRYRNSLRPIEQQSSDVTMSCESIPGFSESQRQEQIELLIAELKHIYTKLEEQGITYEDARQKLWNLEPISRVMFQNNNSIVLIDYDIEIKLTPIQFSLYLFFIRHPERIFLKDIADYRNELKGIYRQILIRKSKLSPNEARVSSLVERLTTTTNHSLLEYISQIRKIFVEAIGCESKASHYYIKGARNMKYGISISRQLVKNDI